MTKATACYAPKKEFPFGKNDTIKHVKTPSNSGILPRAVLKPLKELLSLSEPCPSEYKS